MVATGIKHISLDMWNTLLIPNPEYAKARTFHLSHMFGVSEQIFKVRYTTIKQRLDKVASEFGYCATNEDIIKFLISEFDADYFVDHQEVLDKLVWIYKAVPATFLPEIAEALDEVRKKGISISITSNTNFLPGSFMRTVMNNHSAAFDFMLFSDSLAENLKLTGTRELYTTGVRIGLYDTAKPSWNIFNRVFKYARDHHGPLLDRNEILHIGDDQTCDVEGAMTSKFQAIKITHPEQLPNLLREIN